ncbi:heme-binding domain-containing protein [Chitinophaga sp. 2R12]|uniref:Heme-binding domain-containing protein n=2 Tax=Chitinophagaceae TaxID=563835 RepID=A0ABS5J4B2_9BACT|nr:heme-binding domain-containing protein [Chitinophaga hostae]
MAVAALAMFVGIQFIQPVKNRSSQMDTANDISRLYPIPAGIQDILQRACYDCHSNTTRYPWYAHIQPAGWWMASHVKTGKEALNFSEYGRYSLKRRRNKLERMKEEILEDRMPLGSYTMIHTDARLTAEEKALLVNWMAEAGEK